MAAPRHEQQGRRPSAGTASNPIATRQELAPARPRSLAVNGPTLGAMRFLTLRPVRAPQRDPYGDCCGRNLLEMPKASPIRSCVLLVVRDSGSGSRSQGANLHKHGPCSSRLPSVQGTSEYGGHERPAVRWLHSGDWCLDRAPIAVGHRIRITYVIRVRLLPKPAACERAYRR